MTPSIEIYSEQKLIIIYERYIPSNITSVLFDMIETDEWQIKFDFSEDDKKIKEKNENK